MTTTYSQARHAFYRRNNGDQEQHWLKNERGYLLSQLSLPTTTKMSNASLCKQYFVGLGYVGSLADMWFQFLIDTGYTTGSLRYRQKRYWEDGSYGD